MFRPIHPSALQSPAFGFVYPLGRFFFGQIVSKRMRFGKEKKQKRQKNSREGCFHTLPGRIVFALPGDLIRKFSRARLEKACKTQSDGEFGGKCAF